MFDAVEAHNINQSAERCDRYYLNDRCSTAPVPREPYLGCPGIRAPTRHGSFYCVTPDHHWTGWLCVCVRDLDRSSYAFESEARAGS